MNSPTSKRMMTGELSGTLVEPNLPDLVSSNEMINTTASKTVLTPASYKHQDTYKKTFNAISERILDRLESQGLPAKISLIK